MWIGCLGSGLVIIGGGWIECLVAIGGIALTGGDLVFGSGGDDASLLDVADARTVSYS